MPSCNAPTSTTAVIIIIIENELDWVELFLFEARNCIAVVGFCLLRCVVVCQTLRCHAWRRHAARGYRWARACSDSEGFGFKCHALMWLIATLW